VLVLTLAACSDSGDSGSNADKKSGTTQPSRSGSNDATTQQASIEAGGPQAAIAGYLQGQSISYAGDCAEAELPADEGEWCSTLKSSDPAAGTETYDVGPVGEKAEKTVTVKRRGAAQLTPGYQTQVAEGAVGTPQLLTREQLEANVFITGNLVLDQAVGIGNGLADLPTGAPASGDTGGNGGNGGTGGVVGTPVALPEARPSLYPPPPAEIVVENPTVTVGGSSGFRGTGCLPNESLAVTFGDRSLGTVTADSNGAFSGSVSLPQSTGPGTYLLTVQGSTCAFNSTVTVAGKLAFTGSSSQTSTYVLAGLAAVVLGFVLVVATRRRRGGDSSIRSGGS
jgi:LPXTG-motif cell wall-anchored protein